MTQMWQHEMIEKCLAILESLSLDELADAMAYIDEEDGDIIDAQAALLVLSDVELWATHNWLTHYQKGLG